MATEKLGMSFVTTLPAPTVTPSPIFTPGMMTVFPPIQQSFPIATSLAYSTPSRLDCTSVSCVAAKICTPGPKSVRSPMVTIPQSNIVILRCAISFHCNSFCAWRSLLEVCIETSTKRDVTSIVNMERRVDECSLANRSYDLFKHCEAVLFQRFCCGIVWKIIVILLDQATCS